MAALTAAVALIAAAPGSTPAPTPPEPSPTNTPPMFVLTIAKADPTGNPLVATFVVVGPRTVTITTDGGSGSARLPPGQYTLHETVPPPGYQPVADQAVTLDESKTVSLIDQPTPTTGELQVTKTDPNGHTVTVAGAAFAIHQGAVDGPLAAAITTDQSGSAVASGLAPGTYCVVETAAPQGLRLQPTYNPGQCVSVGADPTQGKSPTTVTVADPAAPTPTGELQVVKTDPSGHPINAPGFTFNIHVGSTSGPLAAAVTSDGSGTAVAAALNPATYCVEETAAPDGWQLQATYTPGQCIAVHADTTEGRNPSTVTVADPPAAFPSPATGADEATGQQPPGGPVGAGGARSRFTGVQPLGYGRLSIGLVGFGMALLIAGGAMIVVGLRRRRLQGIGSPTDTWYDSTFG